MRMKKPSGLRHAAILVSLLLPATAFADPLPGTVDPDNGTDPLFDLYEGKTTELTVTTTILGHKVALPFDVENGDVVLCEAGSGACSASDTSNWSDVVRFSGVSLAPGYGNVVNIYSVDDGTLPSASSLSSNACFCLRIRVG